MVRVNIVCGACGCFCCVHNMILNLHCLSPLTIVFSMMISVGLPVAPSNSAFAHPLLQLQYVPESFPLGILLTCGQ